LDIIKDDCRNSFEECSKIYRSKEGSFEIFNFISPEFNINEPIFKMNPMKMGSIRNPMNINNASSMSMNSMNMTGMNPMMNMMNAPMAMNMSNQSMLNMNFRNNALKSISNSLINKK